MNLTETLLNHFSKDGKSYAPSLSEFVTGIKEIPEDGLVQIFNGKVKHGITMLDKYHMIHDYNDSLQKPLELPMLVACDKKGEPIEKSFFPADMKGSQSAEDHRLKLEEAQRNVLFEGFECNDEIAFESGRLGIEVAFHLGEYSLSEISEGRIKMLDMVGKPITPNYYKKLLNI